MIITTTDKNIMIMIMEDAQQVGSTPVLSMVDNFGNITVGTYQDYCVLTTAERHCALPKLLG